MKRKRLYVMVRGWGAGEGERDFIVHLGEKYTFPAWRNN